MLGGVCDLFNRPIEHRLVSLGWLRHPRNLPHILQSCVTYFSPRRRRLKVIQRSDIPTHFSIVPRSRTSRRRAAVVALRERKACSLITPPNGSGATPTLAEQIRLSCPGPSRRAAAPQPRGTR